MFPPAFRRALPGALLGIALISGAPPAGQAAGPPAAISRYFAATGKTLAPEFTAYYDAHGGLAVFGYPIEDAHTEGGFLVQLCERERLEYHPENRGTPYEVLLGRLGADLTAGRADGAFAPPAPPLTAEAGVYAPQTRQRLAGAFLDYWQTHGAVTMFGYPISQEFVENGLRLQWFERARFEFHPELPAAFRVTLGLLGREMAAQRTEPATEVRISSGPPTGRRLQLGLAQGGESHDPAFLHNVIPLIGALHVPLIRLDNIYTSYHVVDRDPTGALRFSWTELDTVVDDIRAMGAQPLLCLSYTPPALSPDGSPIQPPTSLADWRRLVEATVTHFNRDRALGLRYWEVWNEPDQWDFWRGSWPAYLDLYDVTRQAVLSVDPQARVGGPARAAYDAGAFGWLLDHEQQLGSAGGLDFLSWHVYGLSPATVADQIGTARNLLAGRPGPAPELAITEFNVLPGGANDTSSEHQSDTSAGAAYVLSLLERMERAGLDRAFLFEVKDGFSPAGSYWGRWGVTTFDGRAKPVYYALQAFQGLGPALLPAQVSGASGVGALAAAPDGAPRLIVWNTGSAAARTRVSLPPEWTGRAFDITLFDATHNNPQATGDDRVAPLGRRDGAGLIFDLAPGSVLLLRAP